MERTSKQGVGRRAAVVMLVAAQVVMGMPVSAVPKAAAAPAAISSRRLSPRLPTARV